MADNEDDKRPSKRVRRLSPARDESLGIPPLSDITPDRPLSSTHLQDALQNRVDDDLEKRFPGNQRLSHIGGKEFYSQPTGQPGQPELMTTHVERIEGDAVKISRVSASGTSDFRMEDPVIVSREQLTPRAANRLLPPLDLSHDDYLGRAGKTAHALSDEHWERALQQVQNNYPILDIAKDLDVDPAQVSIVHMQVKEIDPASIATRRPFPKIPEAGFFMPDGGHFSAEQLNEIKILYDQNPALRDDEGKATPFGQALGARDIGEPHGLPNPEATAVMMLMRQEGWTYPDIQKTLGIGKAPNRAEAGKQKPHAQREESATRRGLNAQRPHGGRSR
ncbi:hypothetical protein EV217_5055 [Phyllobacterium myrsinacearum]|uniref:hypothetical protein n=1 Tax=Phyllobacterium myrsinacearum TaxID=28101 RepID=UPI001028D7E0|nr:hypothetical protein [Phyllobacterium myrsinacearum]RZS76824.1 hypothetical protein EV217_5055 [Phyllobacterium myrsinacearum]